MTELPEGLRLAILRFTTYDRTRLNPTKRQGEGIAGNPRETAQHMHNRNYRASLPPFFYLHETTVLLGCHHEFQMSWLSTATLSHMTE
jgi:hypothetical protein